MFSIRSQKFVRNCQRHICGCNPAARETERKTECLTWCCYMVRPMSKQQEPNPAMWLATQASKMALYYMASSVSRQDESNPALWLVTQAGKIKLPAVSCTKNFSKSHIFINPLLTKLVQWRWLDIGLILCLQVYGQSLSIKTQKKNLD